MSGNHPRQSHYRASNRRALCGVKSHKGLLFVDIGSGAIAVTCRNCLKILRSRTTVPVQFPKTNPDAPPHDAATATGMYDHD
jgi:hypothetical protein